MLKLHHYNAGWVANEFQNAFLLFFGLEILAIRRWRFDPAPRAPHRKVRLSGCVPANFCYCPTYVQLMGFWIRIELCHSPIDRSRSKLNEFSTTTTKKNTLTFRYTNTSCRKMKPRTPGKTIFVDKARRWKTINQNREKLYIFIGAKKRRAVR